MPDESSDDEECSDDGSDISLGRRLAMLMGEDI
jgi:hypothetical protein